MFLVTYIVDLPFAIGTNFQLIYCIWIEKGAVMLSSGFKSIILEKAGAECDNSLRTHPAWAFVLVFAMETSALKSFSILYPQIRICFWNECFLLLQVTCIIIMCIMGNLTCIIRRLSYVTEKFMSYDHNDRFALFSLTQDNCQRLICWQ